MKQGPNVPIDLVLGHAVRTENRRNQCIFHAVGHLVHQQHLYCLLDELRQLDDTVETLVDWQSYECRTVLKTCKTSCFIFL